MLKKLGALVSTYNKNTGIKGVESADLLVTAAGQPDLVKKENIKDGAWLIDAGTTMIERDGIKCFVGDANIITWRVWTIRRIYSYTRRYRPTNCYLAI
nr:hypothetical protein [Mycoplasmopsis bovis]